MAHVLIIEAASNPESAQKLLDTAVKVLADLEISFDVATVPTCVELSAALSMAAQSTTIYDAYVVLGCVVKEEKSSCDHAHKDSLCGIMRVTSDFGLAVGTGIIVADTAALAMEAASSEGDQNKAVMAVKTAVHMLELSSHFADFDNDAEGDDIEE